MEGAVALSAPAVTQANPLADAAAKTVDQHKDKFTLTTPVWIDNDEYYLLECIVAVAAATSIILAAVANFTFRA